MLTRAAPPSGEVKRMVAEWVRGYGMFHTRNSNHSKIAYFKEGN